jgi:glutaredoxin
MLVEIYSKPDCPLCDEAKAVVCAARARFSFELVERNIEDDAELFARFRYDIPVVFVNGRKAFKHHVDPRALDDRLRREP